jgi:hypothetical protein
MVSPGWNVVEFTLLSERQGALLLVPALLSLPLVLTKYVVPAAYARCAGMSTIDASTTASAHSAAAVARGASLGLTVMVLFLSSVVVSYWLLS